MKLMFINNRLGNTERVIPTLGYIIKENKDEIHVVFPDGLAKINKKNQKIKNTN